MKLKPPTPPASPRRSSTTCTDEARSPACSLACRHLFEGIRLGYNWIDEPGQRIEVWPTAWCDGCEAARREEDGWSPRALDEASLSGICSRCHDRMRARNWREDEDAFKKLKAEADAYLSIRQQNLVERFGIGDHDQYHWDLDTGLIRFIDHGRTTVMADIQIVGSTEKGTWMWAWAYDSLPPACTERLRPVRDYGIQHRYLNLAVPLRAVGCEEEGLHMSAIAAKLLSAAGTYRTGDEWGVKHFVLFDVRMVH